jgi:uncharacterized protein (UPF0371 family)
MDIGMSISSTVNELYLSNSQMGVRELFDSGMNVGRDIIGTIVKGKTSALLGCASAMLLNALKVLAGIDDDVLLIAPEVIKPIQELKINHLGNKNPRLHTDETLIALSISAVNDEKAKLALNQLSKLKNCEMHSSVMLAQVDENVLKKLGIRLTCSC